MRLHPTVAAVLFCLWAAPLPAQWTANLAANTPIADLANDQVVPKVSPRSDGGCYIAWFDHRGANYDVYLQRLDHNGYEVWPHNGILISGNPQNTSLVDWDMITDVSGNAVLVFTDVRALGDLDVYAYLIDPNGAFLWGGNGITLSADAEYEANPVVAEMTDGTFVFAWSRSITGGNSRLVMQKVDVLGNLLFGSVGIEIFGGLNDDPGFVGIVPAQNAGFILSWIRDITPLSAPKHLLTQKFDTTGVAQWGAAPLPVYDAASLPIAYKPEMLPDGSGGAYYAWYGSVGSFYQGRVQHVGSAGGEFFPHNGVEISLEPARSEFNPSMVDFGGDLIVFYNKRDLGQAMGGIAGQRISATGQLLWGNNGIEYVAYDSVVEEVPRAVPAPNGAMCFVEQGNFATTLVGFRVDAGGAALFSPSPTSACTTPSAKDKLRAIAASDGTAILVWVDSRADSGNVYAQNVELDGSTGIPPALVAPYGCGWNEPGTLVLGSGTPAIGTTFSLGVTDPAGSMPPGSTSLLAITFLPAPGHPCGYLVGNTAMAYPGGVGELLIDLAYLVIPIQTGPAWAGVGMPAPFTFPLPYFPPAVGATVYFQGALYDAGSGRVGLSNGLSVRFGP